MEPYAHNLPAITLIYYGKIEQIVEAVGAKCTPGFLDLFTIGLMKKAVSSMTEENALAGLF